MTDEELADVFGRYGVDLSECPAPAAPAPLTSVGERARDDLLACVERAKASLGILEKTLRDDPNNDAAVDAIDSAFGQYLEAARVAFGRFREKRACAGEA